MESELSKHTHVHVHVVHYSCQWVEMANQKCLLPAGVFSDVHMLALMYAGELCYWCWSVDAADTKTRDPDSSVDSTSDSKTISSTASSVVASSSCPPREGEKSKTSEELEGGNSSTPSSLAAVEPPRNSTSDGTETVTTPTPNKTNTEKLLPVSSTDHSVSSSRVGFEQAMQSVSLKASEHSELHHVSACSCHGEDTVRQLFCVMENCQGRVAVENWRSKFNPLKRGQELLSKFVEVARGPLKTQGWKYGRAVQLLVTMKKADH